ncbi:MAG: ABC transporter transmembrane domain-containing protein, partial [Armatimonadota bacterium]|nr:ABC transporter transmembrane domain-containing protein [Armatimonadota bacterium]
MRLPGLLREIVRPHQALLVAAVACVLAATAAGLSVPLLFRDLVDRITVTGDLTLLQQLALLGLGVFVLRSVFLYGQIHLNFTFAHRATADLRDLLFSRVLRWPVDRLGGWHSAEVMSRALQDTQLVHTHLLIGLVDFVATGVQLLGTVVMLFVLDWRLASATFAILPGTALLARHFGAQIQQTSALAQQRVAELATRVRDVIAGARVVRAFVQETREERRFSEENRRLLREQLRIGRLVALEVSAMSLATAVGLIVFLWVGGQLVAARLMTPGELVAFI